jgi:hypothetical protein
VKVCWSGDSQGVAVILELCDRPIDAATLELGSNRASCHACVLPVVRLMKDRARWHHCMGASAKCSATHKMVRAHDSMLEG